ncbi:MAG: hypothetical protein R6V05_03810 [Candidatus Brocadiia bacterium]
MGSHAFAVAGEKTVLDGRDILLKGLRCSNALISDATTDDLIAHLDEYRSYGLNSVSVFFMGSRFGDVKGYNEDATLSPDHAARMGRIIRAADRRRMVVLVGCLYWGNSRAKWESWTQRQANQAVANTARWLAEGDHRNTFIDVDNEGMALRNAGFDNRQLVLAAKETGSPVPVATNYRGEPPPEADLTIHHSPPVPGKPYVESEGSPGDCPTEGGYWGSYSKREGLYGYINVGVYTDAMKESQKRIARQHLESGKGYMLASTWLQAPPPQGPNHNPGGQGTEADPGVRWWHDWLKQQ